VIILRLILNAAYCHELHEVDVQQDNFKILQFQDPKFNFFGKNDFFGQNFAKKAQGNLGGALPYFLLNLPTCTYCMIPL
jgi:hypothetical protein